jgi:AraC family transcriptional regulator
MRICDESRRLDSASALVIEGLMLELLGAVARWSSRLATHPAARWLAAVEETLREQYRAPPSLTRLAQAIGVHPVHIARAFRARHGCSAAGYVTKVRVEHACRLLATTAQSVSEIAVEVGFFDQSHFTRMFRRVMGTTPARYRATCG